MLGLGILFMLVVTLAANRQNAIFYRDVDVVLVDFRQFSLDQIVGLGLADVDAWAPLHFLAQLSVIACIRRAAQRVVVAIKEAFHIAERRPVHDIHRCFLHNF